MQHHHAEHPRAREDELLSQPLGDELLVFDSVEHRAHSLNATAATVWRACDGTRTLQQIAEHGQLDPLAVELALHDLADAKLLEDYTPSVEGVSRRTAIRRIALTGAGVAVALPVIRSIVAPSAALAQSAAGDTCSATDPCTGAGSFCHSDSLCHSSACQTSGFGQPGVCASHPCCAGLACSNSSPGSHHCYAQ